MYVMFVESTDCLIVLLQGDYLLPEFFIKDISMGEPWVTETGKSAVNVWIEFHRELGNMVNTYFQTFLLCLMAYLTLYINVTDFSNRFMGALTSLLVLASLLASIEAYLPKTSYFKMIDVWFMAYIIFIFIIIVFHIYVDFLTLNPAISGGPISNNSSSSHQDHPRQLRKAKQINNVGKIVFPFALLVFTLLYFLLSMF